MRIVQGLEGLREASAGCVLSIGNFDGVHRGHGRILSTARGLAGDARQFVAATFEPHPFTVLRPGQAPPRLTSLNHKQELLAKAGVDLLAILPPSSEILNLTAEQFWAFLCGEVRPADIVEGESFTFGKGRAGTIDRMRQWSQGTGITIHVVEPVLAGLLDMTLPPVSSSLVRWLLSNGRVRDAAICLGRPYALEGMVIAGQQRGRTLGVPTANLDCGPQHIPADGVYAGRCRIHGTDWPAAISIGSLPTFGQADRQVEAHLIGFSGDLYGIPLNLLLVDWLREQRKFPDVQSLQTQLQKDIASAAHRSTIDPARTIGAA
jgi:riboflavin kinase / FMN adenylyltransferase